MMTEILEKLLPERYWRKPPLKPDEFWSALAGCDDGNPVYRAVMHEAVDHFVTNMQSAQAGGERRDEHLARAWAMADFIQRIEEYRAKAKDEVKRRGT